MNERSGSSTARQIEVVREQILRAATDDSFAVIAYCFMPDHVHLLVEASSDASDCLRFIKRAKQFSGFRDRQHFGERLWQRYGYERTLRNQEGTLAVAKYIVENPEDYPFSGHRGIRWWK